MKNFNKKSFYFLKINAILSIFFATLFFYSCSSNDKDNSKNDDYNLYDYIDTYDFPLFIKLNEKTNEKVNYFVKYPWNGKSINSADVKLNSFQFEEFKNSFNLKNYNNLFQVHLLADKEKDYKNFVLKDEDVSIKMVYYLDKDNYMKMDLIKNNTLSKTYNNISNIYASVISETLLSNSKNNGQPIKIMVMNESFLKDINNVKWSLLSEDEMYIENVMNKETSSLNSQKTKDLDQGGCDTCAGDNWDDCSKINPSVCGSVCDVWNKVNILDDYENTINLSNNLKNFFPELYALRDKLYTSQKGNELISDYYDIGGLSFSGEINIPLSVHIEGANIIMDNTTKILSFINSSNSSSILYDNIEAQNYIDFLENTKTTMNSNNNMSVSATPIFNNIIDSLIIRIIKYQNKTINEINQDLAN